MINLEYKKENGYPIDLGFDTHPCAMMEGYVSDVYIDHKKYSTIHHQTLDELVIFAEQKMEDIKRYNPGWRFYKGQKVRCIDKEYGAQFYTKSNVENGEYKTTVFYGKDPINNWEWSEEIKYGELCEVVWPQVTPSGICVKRANGKEVTSLWQWFIDNDEWEKQQKQKIENYKDENIDERYYEKI